MNPRKRQKLEAAGWKFTTVAEFLGLSPEEQSLVELRASIAQSIRKQRTSRGVTQAQVAHLLGTDQSRVAKLEAAAEGVTLDAMFTAYFALGGQPEPITRAVHCTTLENAKTQPAWRRFETEVTNSHEFEMWAHQTLQETVEWTSNLATEVVAPVKLKQTEAQKRLAMNFTLAA